LTNNFDGLPQPVEAEEKSSSETFSSNGGTFQRVGGVVGRAGLDEATTQRGRC